MYVDVHCHLDHVRYQADLPAVIARAQVAGVSAILTSGVNPSSNRAALALAEKYPLVRASLGLYPIDAIASHIPAAQLAEEMYRHVEPFSVADELAFIARNKEKIAAIGEIGLDDHLLKGYLPQQQEVFLDAVALAKKLHKPVVVHTRGAEALCLDLLESSGIKKVNLHCFGGKLSLVKRGVDLGFTFSIPCIIARLRHFQEAVKLIPMSQLLTETDGPYLALEKEGRSEPAHVVQTVAHIARIKELDTAEVARMLYMNYQKLFV